MHRGRSPDRRFYAKWAENAEKRREQAKIRADAFYSMEMRWFQGWAAGSAESDAGGEALPSDAGCVAGAGGDGVSAGTGRGLSSGGARSRVSTGKRWACCSAHFAARPFSGLLVLYS